MKPNTLSLEKQVQLVKLYSLLETEREALTLREAPSSPVAESKNLHYLNYYGFFAKYVVGSELVTEKPSGQGRDSSRLAAEVAVKSLLNSEQLISTLKLLEPSFCNHVLCFGFTLNALMLILRFNWPC